MTSEAEQKTGLTGRCENADCGAPLIGDSVFDKYFKKRICMTCYEKHFRHAEIHGLGEWFEANFKDAPNAYPPEFWRRVGAFVDLSKAYSQDPYR